MKAILIKSEDEIGRFYALSGDNLPENYTLSKQNCDEIFGVVDVEKLAREEACDCEAPECDVRDDYKKGFNKAMELNKDKVFTLEDMVKARNRGDWYSDEDWDNYIESLQQPTIAVVIVTEPMNIDKIREQSKGFLNANTNKSKLDSNGNLILRKL